MEWPGKAVRPAKARSDVLRCMSDRVNTKEICLLLFQGAVQPILPDQLVGDTHSAVGFPNAQPVGERVMEIATRLRIPAIRETDHSTQAREYSAEQLAPDGIHWVMGVVHRQCMTLSAFCAGTSSE